MYNFKGGVFTLKFWFILECSLLEYGFLEYPKAHPYTIQVLPQKKNLHGMITDFEHGYVVCPTAVCLLGNGIQD